MSKVADTTQQSLLKSLFLTEARSSSSAAQDSPPAETMEAETPWGTKFHIQTFRGKPEEPHIIYVPAEYDTDDDVNILAQGFGQHGITFSTCDLRAEIEGDRLTDINSLFDLGEAFFRNMTEWRRNQAFSGPFVIMGRSVGAAVALDMAHRHPDDSLCLVLESAFDRTVDFLKAKGLDVSGQDPEEDPFNNRAKMKKFDKPVLFIHSHRDELISLGQVEWLVAESRSKATQFQVVPSGGRQDIVECSGDLYFNVIKGFLDLRLGRRPPRKSWRERGL